MKKAAGRRVVKVQLSLHTSEPVQQALVYDKRKGWFWQGDATDEIKALMRGRPKAFFWAHLNRQKQVVLDEEAGWHLW